MNTDTINNPLLEAICQRGVLISTSIHFWRGCKRLRPEDLGLDPGAVSKRLIQLGQKRLIPKDALADFALIESRVHATVEGSSFPFLGGIARFVPNPRLGEITKNLKAMRGEFDEAACALDLYSRGAGGTRHLWRDVCAGFNRLYRAGTGFQRGRRRHEIKSRLPDQPP